MPRRRAYDRWLFLTAALLALAGLFMVGSASHYIAMSAGRDPSYFLVRHGVFLAAGLLALAGTMVLPLRRLDDRRAVTWLWAASIVTLIAVLAMPTISGAHRWFRLGPLSLQPSELAKIATILLLAYMLSRRSPDQVNELRPTLVPAASLVGSLAVLIVIEPDLGSAVMVLATAAVMLFVAGLRWKYIGGTAGLAVAFVGLAILAQPYRMARVKTFLNPGSDTQGAGFQLAQSLLAVGSGGVTGVGFGQGQQKAYYLPAAHTDFIFSVIGEELGLIGTLLLLAAVGLLFWRGIRAAMRAPDRFSFYVALGGTSLIVVQSLIHMCVCVGLLPTKGLPFPLVSYGGSSLIATFAVVGLVLNVSQHSN
ncbi:MAG TPA: putative lipid II flippase FtsW [Candidatus Sulfotelmatobacter sp.]|jgi:cell division protein FtsW|nr:putative lipid II flippase FtsW [Candidatus Sulfotelmatobacter sp.]